MIKLKIDFENESDEEVGEKLWQIYISQVDYDGPKVEAIFDMATKEQLACFDEVRRREQLKYKENNHD